MSTKDNQACDGDCFALLTGMICQANHARCKCRLHRQRTAAPLTPSRSGVPSGGRLAV